MSLTDTHDEICHRDALIAARRSLYRMAAGLLTEHACAQLAVADDLALDDPGLRRLVAGALRSGTSIAPKALRAALAAAASRPDDLVLEAGGSHLLDPMTRPDVLGPAAAMLGLDADGAFLGRDDPTFAEAADRLAGGLALARRTGGLADDLFGHVSAWALLGPAAGELVRSASIREIAGLVAISASRSLVDVAEMALHEAAHQKMFDLMHVGDFLSAGVDGRGRFAPSWHPPAVVWPPEQTLAAFHTYACLAEFAGRLDPATLAEAGPESLLGDATARRDEIGGWLLANEALLGRDARHLVWGVLGRHEPPVTAPAQALDYDVAAVEVHPTGNFLVELDASPEHALVATRQAPFVFHFLDPATGRALHLLGTEDVAGVIGRFRQDYVSDIPMEQAISRILDVLVERHLVTLHPA